MCDLRGICDPHLMENIYYFKLLNRLIGSNNFTVGERLASCTSVIASYALNAPQAPASLHHELRGRRIVLVDTPGFDDTHVGDDEILGRIAAWLAAS